MLMKLYQRLFLVLALTLAHGRPAAAAGPDYSDWRLPLPAGTWTISRGPCGAETVFDHDCEYYENQCAIDLVPAAGSMENVPVLAPQAGRVFFAGTRAETGQMLLVLHPDGRVSGYMHLARIVVGLDEAVTRGQVLGYAGATGTARAHLHFFVQRNAVERECLALTGLEGLDYRNARAVSTNQAWSDLTLVDPPPALPDWLPAQPVLPTAGLRAPARLTLSPGTSASIPVLVPGRLAETDTLRAGNAVLTPARRTTDYGLFRLPVIAPAAGGDYALTLEARVGGRRLSQVFNYQVRPAAGPLTAPAALVVSPALVSPAGWTSHAAPPRLCWRVAADRGTQTEAYRYRVVAVGPQHADSGWISGTCWQTPPLPAGAYYWKVFVRDGNDALSRPNQRPFAFVLRR